MIKAEVPLSELGALISSHLHLLPSTLGPPSSDSCPEALHWATITWYAFGLLVTMGGLGSLLTKNSEPPSVAPQLLITRDQQPPPSTLELHPRRLPP